MSEFMDLWCEADNKAAKEAAKKAERQRQKELSFREAIARFDELGRPRAADRQDDRAIDTEALIRAQQIDRLVAENDSLRRRADASERLRREARVDAAQAAAERDKVREAVVAMALQVEELRRALAAAEALVAQLQARPSQSRAIALDGSALREAVS